MSNKQSLIRTVYLYLFSLLGLVLLIIGGVRFVDMGLKTFVFTKADEEERIMMKMPPVPPYAVTLEKINEVEKGNKKVFTDDEIIQLKNTIQEYKNWEERRSKIDSITARRHRDASMNLALILVGFPLYFLHWRIIKRDAKTASQ